MTINPSLLIFDLFKNKGVGVFFLVSYVYLRLGKVQLRLDLPRRIRKCIEIGPPGTGAKNRNKTPSSK